jgi:beta-glucosidase/6-phospho-beta-glucosidase/beta-galactosidase
VRLDVERWDTPATYRVNRFGQVVPPTAASSGLVCNPFQGYGTPGGPVQPATTPCPNGFEMAATNDTGILDVGWSRPSAVVRQPLGTYTETGWEVFPQGLTDLLLWFKQTYGDLPVYITENGAAFFDPPVADGGRVRDPLRVDYLRKHLTAIRDAMDAGVDIRGYMAWSLLDNLEWSLGYSKRFGIVHVNYGTQERTPKDSARWYSQVIASNGRTLSDPLP